jgi:hypothetical protein
MKDCNHVSIPMDQNLKITSNEGSAFEDPTKYKQLVGSLIYLTTTHLDINFFVGILSRFMNQPCEGHWTTTKRVLKYLKGTQSYGIKYSKFQTSISLVIHILTLTEIKSIGDHERNQFQLILQLNTNTLQQLKPQKKSFGFEKFLNTCRRNK